MKNARPATEHRLGQPRRGCCADLAYWRHCQPFVLAAAASRPASTFL